MSQIEVLFENIADRIIQEIGKAQKNIYVAVAWLTNKQLFDALLKKAQQGVFVRLMISNDETNQKSGIDYAQLSQIGDSETILVNPNIGGLMHHKLCIIDKTTIITGSFNWTFAADNSNHENIFIFQDENIAETCIHHFKEMVHHYLNSQPKSVYQNKKATPTFDKNKVDEQLKLAKIHFDKKEFELAFQHYEQAASLGSYVGQYEVGMAYKMGRGVAKNSAKAFEWLQKAASNRHKQAEYELGLAYYYAYGVEKNPAKAAEWFQKSAEQGHAPAQYWLAHCYRNGHGLPKNFIKAAEWVQKAAAQGHSSAQCALGVLYYKGQGVEKNPEMAAEWFQKSAEQGHSSAQCTLGWLYYEGQGVEKNFAKAFELFEKSAARNVHAQFMLGQCYESGLGVTQNLQQAKYWYQKASEQKHQKAARALAKISAKAFDLDDIPDDIPF